ncbi:hypothetical protein NDU88_003599 [Pleurodeles waltl]|uniref:Uncharacterized protein n=1 Tax=Pleurodeles waltl TaxID=8319 RepID=A0AAV7TP20_PLEWA|nr:hypothetical protein NDU88_003599 [Pleurodeles waltl]
MHKEEEQCGECSKERQWRQKEMLDAVGLGCRIPDVTGSIEWMNAEAILIPDDEWAQYISQLYAYNPSADDQCVPSVESDLTEVYGLPSVMPLRYFIRIVDDTKYWYAIVTFIIS